MLAWPLAHMDQFVSSKALCCSQIAEADTNKDGMIDYSEFTNYIGRIFH